MKQKGILKQTSVPWIGAIIDSLYGSLPILSIINFLSITTVLYTNIKEYLLAWAPWITFPLYLCILAFLASTMMVITYKFLLPSQWTFRGKQLFGHESRVVDKLDEVLKRLDKLEKK